MVRQHKNAHLLEGIDSSIEYYPANASHDLERDASYWETAEAVAFYEISQELANVKPTAVAAYVRANLDTGDVALPKLPRIICTLRTV